MERVTIDLPQVLSGKVRELYDAGDDRLLMVASDRVSAFDVIMAEPIADKGRVLTAMTVFWCDEMSDVVPGTLLADDPAGDRGAPWATPGSRPSGPAGPCWCDGPTCCRSSASCAATWPGRPTRSTRSRAPCTGRPCRPASSWPTAWPSPSSPRRPRRRRGTTSTSTSPRRSTWSAPEAAAAARDICLELYTRAAARAADVGFILADTKFELGYVDGVLCLCDEVCTPDSSRLWPADQVVPGHTPPAFDKQPLRDWLAAQGWDRTPAAAGAAGRA